MEVSLLQAMSNAGSPRKRLDQATLIQEAHGKPPTVAPCILGGPLTGVYGFIVSFNGKIRVELLKREWFHTLEEAQVEIERWRNFYNDERLHSALGRMPPSKFAAVYMAPAL